MATGHSIAMSRPQELVSGWRRVLLLLKLS